MTSSKHEAKGVKPAADAVSEARRRYVELANSPDSQERRLAREQLGRLERGANPAEEAALQEEPGIDLAALIGRTVGLRPKGDGKSVGPCPWHSSRSRECLVVWADEGRWWCSSCKRGGDAVAWVALLEGISFAKARRRLGLARGVQAPRPRLEVVRYGR